MSTITKIVDSPEIMVLHAEDNQIPIRIEFHTSEFGGHPFISKVFKREVSESVCDQPDCEFFGECRAQGVCYDGEDEETTRFKDYLKFAENQAEETMKFIRDHRPDSNKDYIELLEGNVIAFLMNWSFASDDSVRLRAENARLKLRLGEYK